MGPPETKNRLAHQDEGAIHADMYAEMRLASQDESSKIGRITSVQVLVNPSEDVLLQDSEIKRQFSKFPMSLITTKNDEENLMNNEEVKNDDDDVCDSMTKEVGSSYNSPDVNMHDKVKTLVEGEVDEEPGGNVSARSRSLRFGQSNA